LEEEEEGLRSERGLLRARPRYPGVEEEKEQEENEVYWGRMGSWCKGRQTLALSLLSQFTALALNKLSFSSSSCHESTFLFLLLLLLLLCKKCRQTLALPLIYLADNKTVKSPL